MTDEECRNLFRNMQKIVDERFKASHGGTTSVNMAQTSTGGNQDYVAQLQAKIASLEKEKEQSEKEGGQGNDEGEDEEEEDEET